MSNLEKLCSLVSMAENMPFNNNRHYLLQTLSSQCNHEIIVYKNMIRHFYKTRHKKSITLARMRLLITLARAYEGLNNKAISLDY